MGTSQPPIKPDAPDVVLELFRSDRPIEEGRSDRRSTAVQERQSRIGEPGTRRRDADRVIWTARLFVECDAVSKNAVGIG